jgi:(p)ppGpp synthase/HD superfamily hydrolase
LEENKEFVKNLKIDVFRDRIFVLTPRWDSISLPTWSTPVDFAYEIHTDLWNNISIAKVNWKTVPLHKELQNWDIIEIITDKNKKPNPFRLSFVKTNKAKNRIKAFLNQENQEEYIERWKKLLNSYLEKLNLPPLDKDYSILKVVDWKENNMEDRKRILERIWNFSISVWSVVKKIYKFCEKNKHKKISESKICDTKLKAEKIIVWDDENLSYKKCKICKPVIWDKIVWYISTKWQITIHKIDCSILQEGNKDRYLPAYFEWQEEEKISFDLILTVKNRKWIIKDIWEIAYNMDLDILNLRTEKPNIIEWKIYLSLEYLWIDFFIMDRFTERLKIKLKNTIENIEIKNVKI